MELVEDADRDKNGKIDPEEWDIMGMNDSQCGHGTMIDVSYAVDRIKQRIPMAQEHVVKARELFQLYDTDADNNLSLNEVARLLEDIGRKITSLPAAS